MFNLDQQIRNTNAPVHTLTGINTEIKRLNYNTDVHERLRSILSTELTEALKKTPRTRGHAQKAEQTPQIQT